MRDLCDQIPRDVLAEIDGKIFSKSILEGIRMFKESAGVTLADSIEFYNWRYAILRETSPEKFKHPHEGYWSGFYS